MSTLDDGDLLTPDEAAAVLRVSRGWVYRLTSQRRLPHLKMGSLVRFRRADLLAWAESQRVPVQSSVVG